MAIGAFMRGEKHHKTTLTDDQVRRIRILYAEGMLQRELARLFRVSRATIGNIVSGKTWGHVE